MGENVAYRGKAVILRVSPDPNPRDGTRFKFTERTVMIANSHRDETTVALKPSKVKRRMRRVCEPEMIIFDRQPLHVRGQFPE